MADQKPTTDGTKESESETGAESNNTADMKEKESMDDTMDDTGKLNEGGLGSNNDTSDDTSTDLGTDKDAKTVTKDTEHVDKDAGPINKDKDTEHVTKDTEDDTKDTEHVDRDTEHVTKPTEQVTKDNDIDTNVTETEDKNEEPAIIDVEPVDKETQPLTQDNSKTENIEKENVESDDMPEILDTTVEFEPRLPRSRWMKYRKPLKRVFPFRTKKVPKEKFPMEDVGLFSYMFINYLTPLMIKIYKAKEPLNELWAPMPSLSAEVTGERMQREWDKELASKGQDKASLFRAMMRSVQTRIYIVIVILCVLIVFSFVGPAVLVRLILEYVQLNLTDVKYGVMLIVLLFVNEVGRTLMFAIYWHFLYEMGTKVRSGSLTLLYNKLLRLSSLKHKSVGEVVNIYSSDGQRLFDMMSVSPPLFMGPIMLIMATVYATMFIGPWALMGIATYLLYYPIQIMIAKKLAKLRISTAHVTDKRVRLISEVFTCIKLIKMYAWEESFHKNIHERRATERRILEKSGYLMNANASGSPIVAIMSGVVAIMGHTLSGNDISPAQAFTLLSIFASFRFAMGIMPYSVKCLAEGIIASKRVQSVLEIEEDEPQLTTVDSQSNALEIKDATLAWEIHDTFNEKDGKPEKAVKRKSGKNNRGSIVNGSVKSKEAATGADIANQTTEELLKGNNHNTTIDTTIDEGSTTMDMDTGRNLSETLTDINMILPKGQLIGVCGAVGCGKSSLIASILGQMRITSGTIGVNGDIAYVPQQAWILNATVKENITFGLEMDEEKYEGVISACGLDTDLEQMPSGDQTEIGERGINLSGGQKQRVSLARAVYSDKEIYLLDDPLSAVDSHVGLHLFNHCIKEALQGKSIVFVTHQLQYLSQCNQIYVMKNGKIVEMGTHNTLLKNTSGEYSGLMQKYHKEEKKHAEAEEVEDEEEKKERKRLKTLRSMISQESVPMDEGKGKLIVSEEKKRGSVPASVYAGYIRAGGGFILAAMVILGHAICVACGIFSNWWLSYWLKQGSGGLRIPITPNMTYAIEGPDIVPLNTSATEGNYNLTNQNVPLNYTIDMNIAHNPRLWFFNLVYGMSIVAFILFAFMKGYAHVKFVLRAASSTHDRVLLRVLRSPMSFFDMNPTGRIINRFSGDMDLIKWDSMMPIQTNNLILNGLHMIFAFAMIAYVFPIFLAACVPLAIVFVIIKVIGTPGVREIKRLENIQRSPLFGHVSATVQGLVTIQAYNKTQAFRERFHELLDQHAMSILCQRLVIRWICVRVDMIMSIIITLTGLFCILLRDTIPPADGGMAISFAMQMAAIFQYVMLLAIEVEALFTSVERLQTYLKIESEAPVSIPENKPASDWPSQGHVTFSKVKLRYREGLPSVLKNMTCDIQPKEKIGIVGRTGAGKSSLGVALFRLVELSAGDITIDGYDISKIGLGDLRSKLSIIPQDPVLFVGTVRYNIDPFSEHTDEEVWTALERCHVKSTILNLEQQLYAPVLENGENFSVGERQLMCMTRALLRNSKILMLDEATSSIDTETDHLIQATIKEAFSHCTMLTIAHRLNTVLHYDRIMVLQDGQIVEFDSPASLMADKTSHFSQMMEAAKQAHKATI
ncbi:unnamed protein product [Owenia fusiformis]|uniref:Uncharacterized protein n=1 Tax=Owenia fusiformis TaxID=6347 RepID=A0A8J1YBS6_OWEFU|nr:unnamed protein product [Owenia fusiformis]